MRIPVIILVMAGGGCGSSAPDEGASLRPQSMVSTSDVAKASASHSLPVENTAIGEKKTEGKTSGVALDNQPENSHPLAISSIPHPVVNDLASPEARTRLRALEHWEQKDNTAPLDPVFEAMEDEDEAVRAKATAIVEQRWAIEQNNLSAQENR